MSPFSQQLKLLLKADLQELSQLSKLLDNELEAVTRRDTKEIDHLAKLKTHAIQNIEKRAKEKARLLAGSGLGISPGKVTEILEQQGDPTLTELWNRVRSAMNDCKDKNLKNGNVISHSLQRTAKLMTIIRGQDQAPNLYGQKGNQTRVGSSTRLGKA